MSFASLNAVKASRGMQGTARSAPAQFQQPTLAPPPQASPNNGNPLVGPQAAGSSYTMGSGMMGTGRQTSYARPTQITSTSNGMVAGQTAGGSADGHGVVAGNTVPSAVGPQQMPAFDPNDPANAALAGYR